MDEYKIVYKIEIFTMKDKYREIVQGIDRQECLFLNFSDFGKKNGIESIVEKFEIIIRVKMCLL